ncbi:hypothetical protein ACLOJK_036093 [Asimina triloba]
MMQQQPLPMNSFNHQPTSCFLSEASPSVKSEGGGRSSAHQQLQEFHYPLVVRGVGGGGGEGHGHGAVQRLHGSGSSSEVDAIKAKIIAHPQYSSLLEAYVDCQKVGAPPEVAARLAAIGQEYEALQRATVGCRDPAADPELDQFMEAYYDMLVKYREELTRPIQEAMDFMKRIESQLNVLTNGSGEMDPIRPRSWTLKNPGVCSLMNKDKTSFSRTCWDTSYLKCWDRPLIRWLGIFSSAAAFLK